MLTMQLLLKDESDIKKYNATFHKNGLAFLLYLTVYRDYKGLLPKTRIGFSSILQDIGTIKDYYLKHGLAFLLYLTVYRDYKGLLPKTRIGFSSLSYRI